MSNLAIKLETIQFHDQSLIVLNHQNKPYVDIKLNLFNNKTTTKPRRKRHPVRMWLFLCQLFGIPIHDGMIDPNTIPMWK